MVKILKNHRRKTPFWSVIGYLQNHVAIEITHDSDDCHLMHFVVFNTFAFVWYVKQNRHKLSNSAIAVSGQLYKKC